MNNINLDIEKVYISKTLREKLYSFKKFSRTIISAPSGFRKSTVVKAYLKTMDYNVIWLDCTVDIKDTWEELCYLLNDYCDHDILQKIKDIGVVQKHSQIAKINDLANQLQLQHIIFVFDNYDNIMSDSTDQFIFEGKLFSQNDCRCFIIGNKLDSDTIVNEIVSKHSNYIGKESFLFSQNDIKEFYKMNSVSIDDDKCKDIYLATSGWPFIVYEHMLEGNKAKAFSVSEHVNTYIRHNVWNKLSYDMQKLLVTLCLYEGFTITQVSKLTLIDVQKVYEYLNSLELVEYNESTRLYTINPVFRRYIKHIFDELSKAEKDDIITRIGQIYEAENKIFYAIKCFHSVGNYKAIYNIHPQFKDLYTYVIKENKQIFLDVANNYWTAGRNGNYNFSIIIMFILFLYNERQTMDNILEDLKDDILSDINLTEDERKSYICELIYVNAYVQFNNFRKMNNYFQKIYSQANGPVTLIAGQVPISFGSPSILSLYHTASGQLNEEINTIENCASNYYRITNGHGKGFEAIFKAEVLYNRGEIEGAEILCHKALYMAESRNQVSLIVCAYLILGRISIAMGDNDAFNEYLNKISTINEKYATVIELDNIVDIAMGFLYSTINDIKNIPDWLKDDRLIEDGTNFITLSYANVIYGKYLIATENYHHFVGISGQFIGLTKVFSYILPRIYVYIDLAIANNELDDNAKAMNFIAEAMSLAKDDDIYMPFIENYTYIDNILERISSQKTYAAFIKNIKHLYRLYSKGIKNVTKTNRNQANYGLTAREADVAVLAAKRFTNKEIADTLFIAESTVKSNMKIIFNKLGINSRNDLSKFFE